MSRIFSSIQNKKYTTKERYFSFIVLIFTVGIFFAFGIFHLGKFETTDEHLWKYDRIPGYWNALLSQDWEKTYINDKPGITVALISGIGLLKEPHPEKTEKMGQTGEAEKIFENYNVSQSERINIIFRLPVLIFSALALFLFFWLILRAFDSYPIALLGTMFIAFNPILVGMAQIINPDSFFWIFGGLASCAYIAFLNLRQPKFLLLTGIFTGLALLSKYTAFLLFLFFPLFLIAKIIFQDPETAKYITLSTILRHIRDICIIFFLALLVFTLFLPAVFIHPEYLFKGISQFFGTQTLTLFFGSAGLIFLVLFLIRKHIGTILAWIARERYTILTVTATLFLLLIALVMINAWSGERLAPVSALRDQAYTNEPKEFNFKPLLDRKDGSPQTAVKIFLMEATPLIFSLSPLVLLIFFCLFTQILLRKVTDTASAVIFTILAFSLAYLLFAQSAHVVTNARYLIYLYPLIALLTAVSLVELFAKRRQFSIIFMVLSILLLLWGSWSLFLLRPFYFSYTNFLLPQTLSIHDSWGHGSYEAAEYLNSLPNAERLIIWSNSDTVCRFFVGQCLKSRRIDLARVTPDYFVISKRGAIKVHNRFLLENNPDPTRDSDYYFDTLNNRAVWSLSINNRSQNFITIIPFEK